MTPISDDKRIAHIKLLQGEECCDSMEIIVSGDDKYKLLGYYCTHHGWLPIPECKNCWEPVGEDRMWWANPHCKKCIPNGE